MTVIRMMSAGFMFTLLVSCAPIVAEQPEDPLVAVINAPAEERVSMVADELQEEVAEVRGCCPFSFARSQPVRFQETHRDLFGSRAAPNSAALARNLGASLAVMAGAPRFERVERIVDGVRELEGEVQLRATVLDAATGESLGSVGSLSFRGTRTIDMNESVPELEEDPLMVDLARQAIEDIAPHLAALLQDLAAQFASGSSS